MESGENSRTNASPAVFALQGKGKFKFKNWQGPNIPVWTYVPASNDISKLPILIVMHGTNRDADRYRNEWAELAKTHGFIVIAPEFSKKKFPGSSGYNLGGVFTAKTKKLRPEPIWSFSAIEPLFDTVRTALGSEQKQYTLYGHSAGAQFVHRYLFYKPDARVKLYLPANAGWYTLADPLAAYPYGLSQSNISQASLKIALQKDVMILLGDKDNNPNHKHLRRTPEALRQGAHRFARGVYFLRNAQSTADKLGVPLAWRIGVARGAKHSNAQMALAAAPLIE